MIHGVDEFFVKDSSIGSSVVLRELLDIVDVQKGLFLNAQGESTLELTFADHSTAQLVVVFEEVRHSNAVFEGGDANLVQNLLNGSMFRLEKREGVKD